MLKNPISFKDLVDGGAMFELSEDGQCTEEDKDVEADLKYEEALSKFSNMNCVGEFQDEDDNYNDNEPFDVISSKMVNLTPNEMIKKRVLREGYGEPPADKSIVKVHYNAYIEYNAEPFDSTYARETPHQFTICSGDVIPGLDIAVQSMKINEKSQFMVKPEFAYGKLGCLNRVPANATVLFEIELLEVIEAGAAENFEHLPAEKQKEFSEVYKYCLALIAKAKEHFSRRNYTAAIKEYNGAVSKLEYAEMHEYSEQEQQQKLLLKLYTNLLVCYTKCEEPKKGCINFNKINQMTSGTDLQIPAKAYYNNAKCLRMLGDFDLAQKRLQKAYELERKNPDILNEFKIIDIAKKKFSEKEKKMAEAFVGV